jgi:hypothetical protein
MPTMDRVMILVPYYICRLDSTSRRKPVTSYVNNNRQTFAILNKPLDQLLPKDEWLDSFHFLEGHFYCRGGKGAERTHSEVVDGSD